MKAYWLKPLLFLALGSCAGEALMAQAAANKVQPIILTATGNTIVRSFIDLPGIRLTHSVNVGSAEQLHYTYDPDNGVIAQVWKGGFLDATPMWHSRGDGSSKPIGVPVRFGMPAPFIQKLSSAEAAWATDTAGSGFRQKGYVLDAADRPAFRYLTYGTTVNDASSVLQDGKGFQRIITLNDIVPGLYARLAKAAAIEPLENGSYQVDKKYYIRMDDGNKPILRTINGEKELIVPVQQKLIYSILF